MPAVRFTSNHFKVSASCSRHDAENSDLFDVLAHVAYALPPITRQDRAAGASSAISAHFNSKQKAFLDFVLSHYVREGVQVRISLDSDHPFRSKPITRFGRSRSRISLEADHSFRSKLISHFD